MAAALVFVLSLMGLLAFILKKLGIGHGTVVTGKKRLKVVEMIPVGPRRHLVLVQCDSRQHLLMTGPETQTVIESDIPIPNLHAQKAGE